MRKLFTLLLIAAFALTLGTASAAQVTLPQSNTDTLTLEITDNVDVSAFNMTIGGLPVTAVTCLDANKQALFNAATGDVIVYGYNNTPIANGALLDIAFDLPDPYGTYTVSITGITGATGEAYSADITVGGDGTIAITFSQADVDATASQVVGMGVDGIDIDESGAVDVLDVQILANNLN